MISWFLEKHRQYLADFFPDITLDLRADAVALRPVRPSPSTEFDNAGEQAYVQSVVGAFEPKKDARITSWYVPVLLDLLKRLQIEVDGEKLRANVG